MKIILIAILSCFQAMPLCAEPSIEDIANAGIATSQNMSTSEASGDSIPNYSKDNASNEAETIDKLDDAELKKRSNDEMLKADKNSAIGITRDAMGKKTLDGFEEHEMFKTAQNINDDPVSAYETIMKEGCTEKTNEPKNQYTKKVTKAKQYDTELYEETCEKPSNNIVCEKTLNVACEAMEECQSGGIVKGSMDTGIEWDYNYPNLRLGTPGTYYLPGCADDQCCKQTMSASFNLRDVKEIRTFALKKVFLNNFLQVKVNGHVVYNNLGGNKLDVTYTGRHTYRSQYCPQHQVQSNNYKVDAGNGRVESCILNGCKENADYVDVDLKPYLLEGKNTVEMEVVWSFGGHIHIEIEARQQCCTKLTDKWEKKCWNE